MSGVKKKNHLAVFKPRTKKDDNAELSEALIVSARRTGQMNLSSKGLFTVPTRVWTINDLTEEELKKLHFELDYEHKEERWWEQEILKILDLSNNSIMVVDTDIECLLELVELNLHSNLIEELPQEIGNLRKLKKLDISDNKLQKLPNNFYKLEELRELNLRNNMIKELDASIGDLIMLTHLNLSYNNLCELPIGMGYLVRLISLDLSHNVIQELPPDITNMRVLQKLDASFNDLEIVPPFGELRRMESISLQANKLTAFPDMTGCSALKILHLSDNNIPEIELSCLEGIGQVKTLTLGNNKIKKIPEDVICLINLEILDLSHNNISLLPYCIGIMPNLKKLSIEGNNIKNVRADIIRCGTSRILKHIRQNIDSRSINSQDVISQSATKTIYPDKYAMRSTKLLSLAGQNLIELPENVLLDAEVAEVNSIDLSRNKLSKLPKKLSEVTTVTDLKLTSNQLTNLAEWIGESYKYLQTLDLSKNLLKSLPASINLLCYMKEINISFNRFTELPEPVYDVVSLEILIASDNLITEIDVESLRKLKRLATLDLTNNDIMQVPPELGNLTNLRNLLLSGNCFKHPRQAILAKGTEELLAYLRNRIPQ